MTKKFALVLVSLMVLAAIAVGSASAGVYAKNISTGDTVFIGESGLNISGTLDYNTFSATIAPKLAWYAAGSAPATDVPAIVYPINGTEKNFAVEESMFSGYTGSWYSYNGTAGSAVYAFQVLEPSLKATIYNNATEKDITNKKVVADDTVTFRIDSNLYALFARQGVTLPVTNIANAEKEVANQTSGIDIKVTTPDGATLIALYNQTEASNSILGVQPSQQIVYLINNDIAVDAWKLSLDRYTPGIYSVHAECNVNNMKTNLGSITGKTISATGTLEMTKDDVTITTDKETVIRNNDFSITLEGRPKTNYYVWFSGTSSYASARNATDVITADIPPIFSPNQEDVAYLSGNDFNVVFKGTTTLASDVAVNTTGAVDWSGHGVNVTTGTDGTIVIGVSTHSNTKATTYTIRAQKWVAGSLTVPESLYETVKIKVEKGAVTITASGDGSYYLGEQITLSGTNTDSDYVYLFITGPNLPSNGGKLDDPKTAVVDGNEGNFIKKSVNVDNTWEYKLETAGLGIDAGTYTIYAVNTPHDKDHLSGTKYDTVSIVVKKPFVTATVSASTVAKGDKLYIRGTAEGNPTPGVGIWILGKNYWNGEATVVDNSKMATETVNDDGSFEYEFGSGMTTNLAPGQYFVVVQHPMYNDRFDVDASSVTYPFIVAPPSGTVEVQEGVNGSAQPSNRFIILGATNKLQGSDAANALIEMIDSPDIDDTYTKLTFLIEEPWIRINAIGDHYVGDQFTIAGTTNLAVDDDLIVDVTSSSFTATKKSQSGEFSGQSETVKVVEGTTYNEWSMDVDASTFKADEYIVNVESIETSATATTTFNILTGGPTATVTGTATTGPVVTTTATATQATPTETAAPGFGALVALIGLGAVAALVLRKE